MKPTDIHKKCLEFLYVEPTPDGKNNVTIGRWMRTIKKYSGVSSASVARMMKICDRYHCVSTIHPLYQIMRHTYFGPYSNI